jgi:hypothetical protein
MIAKKPTPDPRIKSGTGFDPGWEPVVGNDHAATTS